MAKNIVTGIDAGTSTIKVVIAEQRTDGSKSLHILGIGKKLSRGIRRGYITSIEETADSIRAAVKEAETMAGVQVKRAFVSIGGISLGSVKSRDAVMISKTDGLVTNGDIRKLLSQCENNLPNISNKKIIHSFPSSFKIDGKAVIGQPIGMKGNKLEADILFVTCINQHLSDLIRTVELAGIVIEDIVASSIASSSVVLSDYQKEAGCVLANIGSGTVSIAVFEEKKPIALEVFPIGSTHITNDIALGLQISLEEAERIKIEYGTETTIASKRKLSDIVGARLNDIFELIEASLKKINRSGLLPAGIILTGGGSNLLNLEAVAKKSLKLPSSIGKPSYFPGYEKATVSKNCREDVLNNPERSVSLGLCVTTNETETKVAKIGPTIKNWFKALLP